MELRRALDRFLAENVKGVSIDPQAVLAHVIRPPSNHGAVSDRGTEGSTVQFKLAPRLALSLTTLTSAHSRPP